MNYGIDNRVVHKDRFFARRRKAGNERKSADHQKDWQFFHN